MRRLPLILVALMLLALPVRAKKTLTLHGDRKVKTVNEKILKLKWSRGLKSGAPKKRYYPELSQPVLDSGVIYVGTQGKIFYAVDAAAGKILWKYKNAAPIAATAAVGGGHVFFADLDGSVVCLNAMDGTEVWRHSFDREMLGQPLLFGANLYLIKGEQDVLALAQKDGRVVWEKSANAFIKDITMRGHAAIRMDGGRLYAGLADGQLYAFNPASGAVLWSKNLTAPLKTFKDIDAAVVFEGDALYVGGYTTGFYKLNKATGTTQWRSDVDTGVRPAVLSNTLVVADTHGRIVGLDKSTGAQTWFNDLNHSILSEPVVIGDKIFVGTYDENGYVIDPTDGTQIQKIGLGSGSINAPVVVDNHVFVLTNSGRLSSLMPR